MTTHPLALPLDQLRDRYDPQTWSHFQQTAQTTQIQSGLTLWQWLTGTAIQSEQS
jgi:hypothetical protein